MAEFLREIRDEPAAVDLGSLIKTLLAQCGSSGKFVIIVVVFIIVVVSNVIVMISNQ